MLGIAGVQVTKESHKTIELAHQLDPSGRVGAGPQPRKRTWTDRPSTATSHICLQASAYVVCIVVPIVMVGALLVAILKRDKSLRERVG